MSKSTDPKIKAEIQKAFDGVSESLKAVNHEARKTTELVNAIIGCAFAITETLDKNPFTEEEMETIIHNHTDADGETDWNAVSEYKNDHTAAAVGQAMLNLVDKKP